MRKGLPATRLSLETVRHRLRYSKRLLINRRGDGVHSPFAFHFITKVVRNHRPFYCFAELAPRVKEVYPLSQARRQRRICELLFRASHALRVKNIVHLGASVTPLKDYLEQTGYVTSWASCATVEELAVHSAYAPDLVILEDPSFCAQLHPYLMKWQEQTAHLILAVYTLDRGALNQWKALQAVCPARLRIDLLDLQFAFYDERLTTSSYKGIY